MQRIIPWCLGLLVLLAGSADAKVRIYVANAPYTGPQIEADGLVFVEVQSFARTVGWTLHQPFPGAYCLASKPHAGRCPVPPGGRGLFVEGKPFAGHVRESDGSLYVAVHDLAAFLGGKTQRNEDLGILQADIPGMPAGAATDPVQLLQAQLRAKPFTLVQFYLDGDQYCQRLRPQVKAFASHHAVELRVVDYNLRSPGAAWIYARYKTPNNGIPELVLLNSDGTVLQKLLGETDEKGLEKELAGFLKGR